MAVLMGKTAKGIVVIIPDAFGIDFVNNKILADTYATKGDYKVYLPDFMLGHSCPSWILNTMTVLISPGNYLSKPHHFFWAMYGLIPWIIRNRPGKSFPIVKAFFEALRKEVGPSTPIGAAGFCWGGKHVVLLADPEHRVDDKPMYDAGFTGHPSFLEVPKDIQKIAIPISFAVPEKDNQISVPKDTDVISKIMEDKKESERGEVRVYQGCGHGFCVRADPTAEDGLLAIRATEAEGQAIEWFHAKLPKYWAEY
ncbi:Protein AIM2 [Cytospora mali]|uniref:Protein AIM2 n=1 Tax=Cytospora mali TaxID=578113 RepID=A0A194W0V6_CYTMA|nr:Protein AIM2 [Valsa mali]